jgi:GntR family transcriptional regulator/MocR family aminotransferase
LPKRLVKDFDSRLGFYSCTVPTFEQYVVARLLQNGDFERHINKVRRKKRKELSQN